MAYQQLPPQGYGSATITITGTNGPPGQTMSDYRAVLNNHPGLLVRQRLRLKNLCICMIKNKYDIGSFPQNMDAREAWEDDVFKHQRGLMYATEESECIDKVLLWTFSRFYNAHPLGAQRRSA
jgi:hypothetical protein